MENCNKEVCSIPTNWSSLKLSVFGPHIVVNYDAYSVDSSIQDEFIQINYCPICGKDLIKDIKNEN